MQLCHAPAIDRICRRSHGIPWHHMECTLKFMVLSFASKVSTVFNFPHAFQQLDGAGQSAHHFFKMITFHHFSSFFITFHHFSSFQHISTFISPVGFQLDSRWISSNICDTALRRMRSSFNALINRGPEENFMFTTILLLSVSVYMGVAFKDIAVIKMIKGTAAVQHVTLWV